MPAERPVTEATELRATISTAKLMMEQARSDLRALQAASPCAACGGPLPPAPKRGEPSQFCSRKCRRRPEPKPCRTCGKTFQPQRDHARYCSPICWPKTSHTPKATRELEAARQEIRTLAARLGEAEQRLAKVRALEWDEDLDPPQCPWCLNLKPDGHDDDCPFVIALAAAPAPGAGGISGAAND